MVAAANNPFPSILTVEGTTPATPAAGQQRLFVRSSDHVLCYVNSSGTVSAVSTGMSNVLTTTGDIIYSSSGTTAARLAVGTAVQVLHGGASVPAYSAVVEGDLSTSDITTANATTSKHGFAPKYPNDATKYLDGTGAYTVPAGGGGGLAASFVGTNSIGGTWTTVTAKREYMKKVTLAATTNFQSIDIHVRPSTDDVIGIHVGILSDTAGSPNLLLAGCTSSGGAFYLSNSASMPGTGRWLSIPIGATLVAGDYWIAFMCDTARIAIANDGSSGTNDQYFTSSVFSFSGTYPSAFPVTSTSTPIYSIRASVLS